MKKDDLKKVHLEWIDSKSWSGWHGYEAALEWAESDGLKCETVAYLVFEDDVRVAIAPNLFLGEDGKTVESLGDIMCIPKIAIQKRRYLK